MFTHYLQSIEFVALYPIVSLVLFFTVFIGVVVWALKVDSGYIRAMEQLPLTQPHDDLHCIQHDTDTTKGSLR